MTKEEHEKLLSRVVTLRGMGLSHITIADTLSDEGFTTPRGLEINHTHINGYLATIKKRGNGSSGLSTAEKLAAEHATIEAQIEALREKQAKVAEDLPRLIIGGGPSQIIFEMTRSGGFHCDTDGSFELDHDQTAQFVRWIKEHF